MAGGHAEKAGVHIGDVITETSAVVLKAGKEGEYERVGYAFPHLRWHNC